MKKALSKLAMALSFMLLVTCGESADDSTIVDSQKHLSPAEPSTGAKLDAPSVDAASADAAQPLDDPDSDTLGDIGFTMKRWTGDLDVMENERIIRILTVYGLGRYFLDGHVEKGLVYETGRLFEGFINERLGRKNVRIHVVIIPVARDQLIPGLLQGRGDVAIAGLTITPERAELISFTKPATKTLSEILVTGPASPELETINDLSGQEIYVRKSSSYYQSLLELNARLEAENLSPVVIKLAREALEDEDILEMVNAGMLNWAIVDDYKAELWAGVLTELTPRKDIELRRGGQMGYAVRKDSVEFLSVLNDFLSTHRQGTLQGNMLINRWYRDFDWTTNALAANDYHRFNELAGIFQTYGKQYGFDYLMVAAQGYQESRLDQNARSHAGAVGVMQLLPTTASDPNVGIPDISKAENNIHAGVKYLDWIRKRYFNDPEITPYDQTLFAFAAYNAGPARVRKLRAEAVKQGYDPNIWFDNVELVSARVIGRETGQYVANIVKYYIAYRLSIERQVQRSEERKKAGID